MSNENFLILQNLRYKHIFQYITCQSSHILVVDTCYTRVISVDYNRNYSILMSNIVKLKLFTSVKLLVNAGKNDNSQNKNYEKRTMPMLTITALRVNERV